MAKRKPIPKKVRQALYEKYNHRCAYCGCELEYKDMQVDHIISVYRNELHKELSEKELCDINNLLPTCRQCNFYKSDVSIEKFRKSLTDTLLPNITKTFQFRLAKKYGLVSDNSKPIKFYFEELKEMEKK